MDKINGYIKNYNDAYLIMHSVRLGIILPRTERLTTIESHNIETGDIYCFIEDKIKRWTDGRMWSPSKISGEFLLYHEISKELNKQSKDNKLQMENAKFLKQKLFNCTTLHKKTISIKHNEVKYHIISYFRPIYANSGISNLDFFKKIDNALKKYPELKNNKFIDEELRKSKIDFFQKYNLPLNNNLMIIRNAEDKKKIKLEVLVLNTLVELQNKRESYSFY